MPTPRAAPAEKPIGLAYIIDERSRSNKDSIDHVFRVANGLRSLGIGKGDRIAILSCNSVECAEAMTAILAAGASMVPIPSTATADAQRNMLEDSAVKGIFVSDQYRDAALNHFMGVESIKPELRFALETACDVFADHRAWANEFSTDSLILSKPLMRNTTSSTARALQVYQKGSSTVSWQEIYWSQARPIWALRGQLS